ncbi:hypothetical protein IKS57_02520 [bacterium]|nr:hypothetical protein [bacterium]
MVLAHNFLKANDLSNMKALLYSHYLAFPFLAISKKLDLKKVKLETLKTDVDIYDENNNQYTIYKNNLVLKQNKEIVAALGLITNASYLPKLDDDGFYLLFGNND